MDIAIRGKNFDVTPALQRRVQEKFIKLDRYLKGIRTVQVLMVVEKEKHEIEVTVPLTGGLVLRAEASAPDMYAVVDVVLDKLVQRLKRYNARLVQRQHADRPAEVFGSLAIGTDMSAPEPEVRVVRMKRFTAKPMTVDEAALQMDLLGHDFFVYFDEAQDEVHVMYRRREGGLGVLIPQR